MKGEQLGVTEGRRPAPPPSDADGFLLNPHGWNRGVAQEMARQDGIGPLNADHWAVIYYLREHRLTYGSLPPMSQVCRTRHLDRGAVQRLFDSRSNYARLKALLEGAARGAKLAE